MRRGAIAAAASVVALTGAAAGAQAPTLLPVARGGFVLLVGADTFAVEHVTRTVSGFEGELFLRGPRQRIAYTATTEPDARVHRVQLYQWA
ncbi:MAG: hypothetical protein ACXWZS_17710, partial [Gemmatirosa sp.]